MHKLLISLLALGLAPATLAHAQEAAMPAPAIPTAVPQVSAPALSADEQAYVTQEAALVRSLRLMSLQAQIAEQHRKVVGEQTAAPQLVSEPLVISSGVLAGAAPRVDALPFTLISVWGAEGLYNADLVTGSLRVTVKEGDTLPDGWRVTTIARTGMRIARGKTVRTVMVGS